KEAAHYFVGEQETYRTVEPVFAGREEIVYVESWQRRRDGETRLLAWWCKVLKDRKGTAIGALSSARDITDGRRTEERIRESEEHFRSVIEASPMGIHIYQVTPKKEPVFIGYNPAAERILGFDHAPLLGKPLTEAFPGLKGTNLPDQYARVALTGELWHDQQVNYQDERIIGAYDVYAFRIKPGLMAALFTDITERLRMETKIREQREFITRIMETSPVCIVTTNRQGKITFANSAAERVLGLSKENITDRVYNDPRWRITDMDGQPIPDEELPFQRVMRAKKTVAAIRHAIEWPDGRTVYLSVTGSPLSSPGGEVGGVVFAIDDITEEILSERERQKLEEQLLESHKLESIGRLAGGLAHDLNNLLTPIIGYADFCLADELPGERELKEIFKKILQSGEDARLLASQMLAFGRRQPLEIRRVDVGAIINELKEILTRSLRESILFRIDPAAGLPPVSADRSQIEQILIHLVANAQDAISGSGEIRIASRHCTLDADQTVADTVIPSGEYVVFSVTDNGEGMDGETLRHVFEPFYSTKKTPRRVGMGLPMVYGLVKQHGGSITVESGSGKGTVVSVYLPVTAEQAADADRAVDPTPRATLAGKVLLVEDNEEVRNLTRRLLESIGFQVVAAENGRTALTAFVRHADLVMVVSDVIMPDMNGAALYARLKEKKPDLPILYMSGYTSDIISTHGSVNPNAPLIMKPFTLTQLKNKITEVLGT
ncbi:MAG TPA: PAS domain S-box protein, partial [Spirochaetia bacterium]|nr:PAS domain S-box protein [Spirochaetia bacterium]